MTINSAGSEKHLLETLDRISRSSTPYSAVYIHISKLQPKNRHPKFLRILAKLFDGLVGAAMGAFFVMSNGDFVILGTKVSKQKVEEAVEKLKKSMKNDPIVHNTDATSFIKMYNFPEDLSTLYLYITTTVMAEKNIKDDVEVKRPIENQQVESVLSQMSSIDFTKIIKRQSVVKIVSSTKFKVMSQEFFVAVKDLNKEIGNGFDVSANKWMFIYLTEALDKHMMKTMFFSNIKKMPDEISLNLNLSSVFTKQFEDFTENFLGDKTSLIVEVQLMDVFNNMDLYFEVKEKLHQKGAKILIDGVGVSILKMVNLMALKPDYLKLFWQPLMEFEVDNSKIKKVIDDIGPENVVLAKCANAKSIEWGYKYGISSYQGPYIDELETGLIKAKCPNNTICSNLSCLKRRRLISGDFRDECDHIDVLETLLEGDK